MTITNILMSTKSTQSRPDQTDKARVLVTTTGKTVKIEISQWVSSIDLVSNWTNHGLHYEWVGENLDFFWKTTWNEKRSEDIELLSIIIIRLYKYKTYSCSKMCHFTIPCFELRRIKFLEFWRKIQVKIQNFTTKIISWVFY